MRSVLLALLCLLAAADARASSAIWEALRAPGSVVVVRHSYAPGTFDPPTARLDDCSTQRNLDAGGRAQARRIGEAFRRHGITAGPVLSSPRCRCMDTARLAFGSAQAWEPLQGALRDQARRQQQLVAIRDRISQHVSGPPLVLVTHGSVVTDLTGLSVPMGGIVVMRRTADGRIAVVGDLYID